MKLYNTCRIYKSISKIEKVKKCDYMCSCCKFIDRYKELVNEGKIDIISDLANFRDTKHPDKKKRSVKKCLK